MATSSMWAAAVLGTMALGVLWTGHGLAAPRDPGQFADDTGGDTGATRDFYNRAGDLRWNELMGDYHDAQGTYRGDQPYATVHLEDDDTPRAVVWNVTSLVNEWHGGVVPSRGFYLLATSGSGPYDFHSRESDDATVRPRLRLSTSAGDQVAEPVADTWLEASTYRGFGHEDRLRVSNRHPALVRFDLSDLPGDATIQRAELELHVYALRDAMDIGVFRCSHGHDAPEESPTYGIAADFPLDRGIETHADVVLFTDFEQSNWGRQWTDGTDEKILTRLREDESRNFEPLQGHALRGMVPANGHTGMDFVYKFAREVGSEPEEIYFRYYIRFPEQWQPSFGGKLPGVAGTYGKAGWGGRRATGADGWSTRGQYWVSPPEGNPLSGVVPIGNYVYHVGMEGSWGDWLGWQQGYRGYLERDRWYSVEMFVKLNTPGQPDGVLRGWVDGRPAFERSDLVFRNTADLKIEQVWMNVYHGGTAAIPADGYVYVDNIVVARSYIGPMLGQPAGAGR